MADCGKTEEHLKGTTCHHVALTLWFISLIYLTRRILVQSSYLSMNLSNSVFDIGRLPLCISLVQVADTR